MTNGAPKDLYVPSDVHLGGQRTSASQLKRVTTCWQYHFLCDLAPHPDIPNSAGLATRVTGAPLVTGSGVHAAIHSYFLSGFKDGEDSGERDVMKALAHAEEVVAARQHEMDSPEDYQKALNQTRHCLIKFDEQLTAGGLTNKRVVADANGEAVLEREFQLPLAEGRFVYTDKVDGVFENDEGYHEIGEYKTSTFRFATTTLNNLHMQAQSYGHMGCLTSSYPEAPIGGLLFWVLVKDRGAKSDLPHIYERQVTIPPECVEQYLHDVTQTLEDMVSRATAYTNLCNEGLDAYQAGLMCYPQTGIMNGQCYRYNRPCEFAGYCEAHGYGSRMLQGFRPRTVAGEPYKDESERVTQEGEPF